ncbi:MAG: nucleoside recognition protein [Ruminococcaceae bacterium]|nr:nucleoside recognition protein [Oscillospiraceae bacterium]
MLNAVWLCMLVVGIGYGCFNGTLSETGNALLESGGSAVTFVISIIGVTALWSGLLEVFQKAGGIVFFSRIIRKPIRFLLPGCKNNFEAEKQVITNIAANFFGLGNGATPSGIEAVKELQRYNGTDNATFSVGMFLVMNSAAFQLLPTTVLALRTAAGSNSPTDIIFPVWIASAASLITGIVVYRLISRRVK